MQIVRIIIIVFVITYLLLAIGFTHLTLRYKMQLFKSSDVLYSLFAGQIALLTMLSEQFNFEFQQAEELNKSLSAKEYRKLNKELADLKLQADTFVKTLNDKNAKVAPLINGLEENVVLIRNEVYRYNKVVENLNINKASVIFALFVVILHLDTFEKI